MKAAIAKFMPQNFNDFLTLILIGLIVALWLLTGAGIIALPEAVIGATIVTWTLLIQYYFRKKVGETGS